MLNKKLAAVVVLYKPDHEEIRKNLKTYINSVEKVFMLDNTPEPNKREIENFFQSDRIEYLSFGVNLGLARALNIAFAMASKQGYNFLLTMDQDSYFFNEQAISLLLEVFDEYEKVGISAPVYVNSKSQISKLSQIYPKECFTSSGVITSGSVVRVEAWKKVDGFNEKYFIDFVDNQFCAELIKNNYRIYVLRKAILIHALGDSREHLFLGKMRITTNHSALRRYYIVRNRFLFFKEYKNLPEFNKSPWIKTIQEIVKVILFEEKKLKKLRYIGLGLYHFYIKKFGKKSG